MTGGMMYFPRMLDKIRLHARGELGKDYHANLGHAKAADGACCALAKAKAEPAVIEALGSPIRDGLFVSGRTNLNGASGEANLAIPIYGPKGKGTLYVVAEKSVGFWNYSNLVVEVSRTKKRMDLLHESQ
jgi:hypothetical protein